MSEWSVVPCHTTFDVLTGKGGCWARCGLREEVQTFPSSSFCFSRHRLSSRALSSITAYPLCRITSQSGQMCSPRQPLPFSRAEWRQSFQAAEKDRSQEGISLRKDCHPQPRHLCSNCWGRAGDPRGEWQSPQTCLTLLAEGMAGTSSIGV